MWRSLHKRVCHGVVELVQVLITGICDVDVTLVHVEVMLGHIDGIDKLNLNSKVPPPCTATSKSLQALSFLFISFEII